MFKKVDFAVLEQLYDVIMAIDKENEVLSKAVRAMSRQNHFWCSDNVVELEKLAYTIALGGDEMLIYDFEYLLYEVPAMDDGGCFRMPDGKLYPIRKFEDLRRYWVDTGVVGDG